MTLQQFRINETSFEALYYGRVIDEFKNNAQTRPNNPKWKKFLLRCPVGKMF